MAKTADALKKGFNALAWEDLPGNLRYQIEATVASLYPFIAEVRFVKYINGEVVEEFSKFNVDESASTQLAYPTAAEQIDVMLSIFKSAWDNSEYHPPVPVPKPVLTYGEQVANTLVNLEIFKQATGEIVLAIEPVVSNAGNNYV